MVAGNDLRGSGLTAPGTLLAIHEPGEARWLGIVYYQRGAELVARSVAGQAAAVRLVDFDDAGHLFCG